MKSFIFCSKYRDCGVYSPLRFLPFLGVTLTFDLFSPRMSLSSEQLPRQQHSCNEGDERTVAGQTVFTWLTPNKCSMDSRPRDVYHTGRNVFWALCIKTKKAHT